MNSQERQRRSIEEMLLKPSELLVLGEYIDNESGLNLDRPNYQKMLEDGRQGKFSHVAVETPDRFSRLDYEGLRAIDELDEFGIVVRFAKYPHIDPMNHGHRPIIALLFSMGWGESMQNSERTTGGIQSKLRRGGSTGRAPDGYLNTGFRTTREQHMAFGEYTRWVEPDPDRWHIFREAWDLLLTDQYTLREICIELHQRGYKLQSGRLFVQTVDGGPTIYAANALSRIFKNCFYAAWVKSEAGNIPAKTIRGTWQALITDEEYDLGLEILQKRTKERIPKHSRFYLMKGLIFWENRTTLTKLTCSTPNVQRKNGGTSYYRDVQNHLHFACQLVDSQIHQHLSQIVVHPNHIASLRQAYMADVKLAFASPQGEIIRLEKRQHAIKAKLDRVMDLYIDNKFDKSSFNQRWQHLQSQIDEIERQIQILKQSQADDLISNLEEALVLVTRIYQLYDTLSPIEQQNLLRLVVEKVVINHEGTILRLEFLPPFAYLQTVHEAVKKILASREIKSATLVSGAPINENLICSTFVSLCGEDRFPTFNGCHIMAFDTGLHGVKASGY